MAERFSIARKFLTGSTFIIDIQARKITFYDKVKFTFRLRHILHHFASIPLAMAFACEEENFEGLLDGEFIANGARHFHKTTNISAIHQRIQKKDYCWGFTLAMSSPC